MDSNFPTKPQFGLLKWLEIVINLSNVKPHRFLFSQSGYRYLKNCHKSTQSVVNMLLPIIMKKGKKLFEDLHSILQDRIPTENTIVKPTWGLPDHEKDTIHNAHEA